jgi:hypothetical protein
LPDDRAPSWVGQGVKNDVQPGRAIQNHKVYYTNRFYDVNPDAVRQRAPTLFRSPRLELGAALGLGPAWGWYESSHYAVGDSTTLRSSGTILELRAEAEFPITPSLSVQASGGYRLYGESFRNGDDYASGQIEAPATALDFGLGVRWLL